MAEINNQFSGFLTGRKSIQRSYQFYVDFTISNGPANQRLISDPVCKPFAVVGNDFPIKNWHVKNVVLPQHSFKKEIQRIGTFPRTFPVYESDGMELRVDFEEDSNHTISSFVQYLEKRVMNEYGTYESPINTVIDEISVTVLKPNGALVSIYKFKDCYFLNATEGNYSYASNEAISYVVTFGCDTYELEMYR